MAGENKQLILDLIEDIPDFPKPGVTFKDITPLLASPDGLRAAITELVALAPERIDVVVGMEADVELGGMAVPHQALVDAVAGDAFGPLLRVAGVKGEDFCRAEVVGQLHGFSRPCAGSG